MDQFRIKDITNKRDKSKEKFFMIYQFNCNGISSKLGEIKLHVYLKKPDVLCLCETWMKEHSIPKVIGYKGVWKTRVENNRGGLGMLIREDVIHRQINLVPFINGNLEFQTIQIQTKHGSVDVMNIYNPSRNVSTQEFLHYINQLHNKYLLIGDFNAHSQIWDSKSRVNYTGRAIEAVMNITNLRLLNEPDLVTYIDQSRMGIYSCLDLCFGSPDLVAIGEIKRGPDMGSDHFPIECCFGIQVQKDKMKSMPRWKL